MLYGIFGKGEPGIIDIERRGDRSLRIPFDHYGNLIWHPDGKHIVFHDSGDIREPGNIYMLNVDGTGEPEKLCSQKGIPCSWSKKGDLLAFFQVKPGTRDTDIYVLRVNDCEVVPIATTETPEQYPAFSPDGRWIAYWAEWQVLVKPFPGPGGIEMIPTEGGPELAWGPDGRELFYVNRGGSKMMAVNIDFTPEISPGMPRELFNLDEFHIVHGTFTGYDISPDGCFVALQNVEPEWLPVTHINIVQNWFEELKRLVPTGN